MFIPLHDTNPLKRIHYQYVTVALIVLNVAIYAIFETGWVIPLDEENTAATTTSSASPSACASSA